MTDDNSSIIDQLERVTEAAAAEGLTLRRMYGPPWGWELLSGSECVQYGPLGQLEAHLKDGTVFGKIVAGIAELLPGVGSSR